MSRLGHYHPTQDEFESWLEDNPDSDWEDFIDHLEACYDAEVDRKIDEAREARLFGEDYDYDTRSER